MRLADARRDHYRKLAKDEGYRSRSAFKLIQLNHSYRIFHKGSTVVDLGCAPGGWMQVAKREVGETGYVVGVDIKAIDPILGTKNIIGSISDDSTVKLILDAVGRKVDVVLSDLAPNVSGVWDIDHERQIDLTRSALQIAKKVLRPQGCAIFKVFEGSSLSGLHSEMKSHFARVVLGKPKASRQESSELYIVCMGFLGNYPLQTTQDKTKS